MTLILALLTQLNFAGAEMPANRPIALSPDARHALVRVSIDGRFTIADCAIDKTMMMDLSFSTPESIRGCVGGVFAEDTPEMRQRFEEAFAEIAAHGLTRVPGRRLGWSVGGIVVQSAGLGLFAYWVAPRLFNLTRGERLGNALTIAAAAFIASGTGVTLANHDKRILTDVLRGPNLAANASNERAPLILVNNGLAFHTLKLMMKMSLERTVGAANTLGELR